MSKAVQHLDIINVNDEYGTPMGILIDAVFNYHVVPKLDVCATKLNAKFQNFYTKEDNALFLDWDVNFFMNPPYSQIKTWMQKAYEDHLNFNVDALILVYAKTDTKWWHEFVEGKAEVHFIKGRIKFLDSNNIQTKNSSPYPSCWIIYRRKNIE